MEHTDYQNQNSLASSFPEKNLILYHTGNQPDGSRILKGLIDNHYRQAPNVPLISIQRKPSYKGRTGGIIDVTCGLCSKKAKFYQKIAEHLISEHWNLSLWHCAHCRVKCRRQYDLNRHQEMHNIARPWKLKGLGKHRRAQTLSCTTTPPPPLWSSSLGLETSHDPGLLGPQAPPSPMLLNEGVPLNSAPSTPNRDPSPVNIPRIRLPSNTMDGYLCPPSPYPRSRRSSHSSMTSNSSDAAYLSGSELSTSYTSPSSLANSPMQPWARLDSYAGSHVQSSELLVPESSYGRNPSPLQSPNHGITRPMHRSDASTMSSRSSPWAYDSDPLPSPFPSPYSTSSAVSRSPISPAISFNHHHGFPSGANNPHAHPMLLSSEVETDTTHITDGLGLFTLDVPDIDFELPPPSIDPNGTTHASTADQSIPKMYAEGASKPN